MRLASAVSIAACYITRSMAHILLVEDDAEVVIYARTLLESHKHTVDVAGDGEAAMVAYMTRRPDVILLDVFVPRIDGLPLAPQGQSQFSLHPIPIVGWAGAVEPGSIRDL